jgi:deoxyadenosine/deoxycytidine kinase
VAEAYAQLFYRYDAAPVLTINSEHLNFAAAQDFELLLERIRDMRGTREFFNREG